jgi:phospholipid-transporting ATPase
VSFFTFLILLNNFIPISLYVSMEMVKFLQALQINADLDMYHAESDTPALARTSNLNEELGQVGYIFSDKTGTLTRNMMQFKKCCVGGIAYGVDEDLASAPHPNFNFNDPRLLADLRRGGKQADLIDRFATVLAVCHTVIPEWSESAGRVEYQASSPDEAALVVAAELWGFAFTTRTPKSVSIDSRARGVEEFELLSVLEFNSDRKRQSVVVRDPRGRLMLWTKGADSVMYERLRDGPDNAATQRLLDEFAEVGLRTLVIAERELGEDEYARWAVKFNNAQAELKDREAKVDAVCELLEVDMELVGMTAIEDKLQDGVPRTIATLALAGLKIWMLTGDKQGTAINIGFSCRLITPRMHQMIINEDTLPATQKVIQEHLWQHKGSTDPDSLALIIDGKTLHFALDPSLRLELLELARKCTAVICCRVTPKQKADVVSLVSDNVGAVTLAIGDGANDVSMIQAAHVGIGISGEEGLQAARAADYAIAQFKYLQKLLLVHGRWSYRRISKLIVYSFYKNIALYATQFWFVFFNGFSGQSLYEGWTIAMFNLLFAAFPILALATLDQDVSKSGSVRYPALYTLGQRSHYFSYRVFWGYIAAALSHSAVLFAIVQATYAHDIADQDGRNTGLYAVGVVLYACVVFVVNLKVALETASWTWVNHLCTWGSCGVVLLFYFIYHLMWDSPLPLASLVYRVIYRLLPSPVFWFVLIIAPIAALLRDFVWKYVKRTYWPELYHIVQEIEREAAPSRQQNGDEFWDARPVGVDLDSELGEMPMPASASGAGAEAKYLDRRDSRRPVQRVPSESEYEYEYQYV